MGCGCNKRNRVGKGIVKKNNNSTLTEKQKEILKRKRKLISIQATKHPKIKNQ
jgi:hypothetical protein